MGDVKEEFSMPEGEWFDVVDALDHPIGRELREEVHRRGLFHRAVHVFVLDGDDLMVVQRRSSDKDTAPGLWCSSCSGHLDAGEDYLVATVRELREELGLATSPEALRQILMTNPCLQTGWEFTTVYFLRADGPFAFAPDEITELRQLPLDELDDWLVTAPEEFSPSFRHLYRLGRLRLPFITS